MVDRFNSPEQRQADEFARFKKDVLDRLDNIEYDNFSPSAKKLIAESASGKAGFEAFATDSSSVARMFAEYDKSLAEIKAVSDSSGAMISAFASRVTDLENSYSNIELSATNAAASAQLASSFASEAASSVASISEKVDANGAFISLMASASNGRLKVDDNGKPIVNEDGSYIYIDAEGNENPVSVDNIAGIYIEAINNGVAGELTKIKLNADVIEFGNYASVDSNGNLRMKRLYHYGGNQFYAQVGNDTGSFADFGVYDEANGYWAWRFFNNDMAAKVIHLRIYEDDILGYNGTEKRTFPKGVWDFSSCDMKNIPLYFS